MIDIEKKKDQGIGDAPPSDSPPSHSGSNSRKRARLTGLDLALLWFGAAVVIDELWSGAQVTPVGIVLGIVLILTARLAGNLLLGVVARMGAETRQPTMVLTRASFGIRGSYIPAVCNILQLIGWTAYMLIVAANAVELLLPREITGTERLLIILLLGLVTTAWAAGGSRYWKTAHRIAVTLLVVLSLVMTWAIFREHSLSDLLAITPPEGLSPMLTFDFIVAMGISWVPLAADYGRFATSRRAASQGTYWGYFVGSSWMYIVGLFGGFAFLALNPGTPYYELEPSTVVLGALGHLNLVAAGLILIVVSTITTTFLDIYSTAASALNLIPRANEKVLTVIGGLAGTFLAFFISMDNYVHFLLLIGVVFLPMFAVVVADYLIIKRSHIDAHALFDRGGEYWYAGGFNPAAVAAWIAGMAVSVWAGAPWWVAEIFGIELWKSWVVGSAIPSFLITALLYVVLARAIGVGRGAAA